VRCAASGQLILLPKIYSNPKNLKRMTQQEALQWIADIFEVSPETITAETSRESIPTWDSIGTLTLMAGMDEKFSIVLNDADIQTLRKVDDIIAVLRRHGKIS
jgi:acyl carrier protein